MYGNPTYEDYMSMGSQQYMDPGIQLANSQAQNAYYNALAAGQTADKALAQAKFEWQKQMDTAAQTGMWNGQWSNPQEQWFTGQFGQWFGPGGAPTPGQQTLTAQQQADAQAQAWSAMFGQYLAPGTAPGQGQQTAAAQQAALSNAATVAGLTGYYNTPGGTGQGTQTLAGQQQQWQQGFQQQQFQAQQAQLAQQNALAYLSQLANLRGPADWAKYQQVLGSTPAGMRDLYAAAMGQYIPGGGATTGVQPQAVSLNTMQQQIAGAPQQTWGSGIGVGGSQVTPDQAVQATGNGTNMYGGQQQQYNLPAPNQISSQAWNNFTPSQQQLMLGNYEAAGWDKNDVQALYNQSLPKYGSNNATAGTWRLQ